MGKIVYPTRERTPNGAGLILEPAAQPVLGQQKIAGFLSADATLAVDGLIWLVASAGQTSKDPLAQQLVSYAHQRQMRLAEASNVRAASAEVLQATVDGRDVLLSTRAGLQQSGGVLDRLQTQARLLEAAGCTFVYVVIDGLIAGAIVLTDDVR